MPTAREHLGAVALGGKVYCIGGALRVNGNSGTNKVEVYDPVTDVWTTKANPPYPILDRFKIAAPGNGRVYLFRDDWTLEYDPAADTWITTKAVMPTPRQDFAVSSAGGKVYVIGGSTAPYTNGASLQVVEAYDPAANSWSSKPQIPTAVQFTAAATINTVIYVIASSSLLAFDTSTNVWSTKAPSPVSSGADLAAVAVGRKAYFWDNLNGTQFFAYDPPANAFRALAPRPTKRFWSGSDTADGKIYVIGGETNSGSQTAEVSSLVEQFTP
jgi:N-acetylneuraminic acid mutarotase